MLARTVKFRVFMRIRTFSAWGKTQTDQVNDGTPKSFMCKSDRSPLLRRQRHWKKGPLLSLWGLQLSKSRSSETTVQNCASYVQKLWGDGEAAIYSETVRQKQVVNCFSDSSTVMWKFCKFYLSFI